MKITWTSRAAERQREWQRTLGITIDEVEEVVRNPQQIVPGDQAALVAQSRRGHGLLRVPFVKQGETTRILTVYWTSRVERYWHGGPRDENSVRF